MKQLLVLSGKGGTGKTTVSGAFISLSKAKAYADCDVDAPNLHLILKSVNKPIVKDFFGLPKAGINQELCIECGKCLATCRFEAINQKDSFFVDEYSCEGCGVCEFICPVNAITMNKSLAGELILYKNDEVFSTAKLKMGSGNSGLLVSDVKKQMKDNVVDCDLAIIDGSPGIGCPVIASISGVDMVLIVTEPSLSGISDMERILKTVANFGPKVAVCINKYDTNLDITEAIEEYCINNNINYVGKIPYDKKAYAATNKGLNITDIDCESGKAVTEIFNKTLKEVYK